MILNILNYTLLLRSDTLVEVKGKMCDVDEDPRRLRV